MAVLQVENLKKNYGGLQVLKGISFSLEKGQVLSIIGSSGSGKTTLLRCLNFLETLDEGRILVNGEELFSAADARTATPAQIREKRLHFGLVFQSFNLFPQYTALQNITLAMDLQEKERARRQKQRVSRQALEANQQKAQALLARVGLAEKAGSYPWQLSGGQQQRVAIARAIATQPPIIMADEPTGALDSRTGKHVLEILHGLHEDGSTIILITHDNGIAATAQRIIRIADGRILYDRDREGAFS